MSHRRVCAVVLTAFLAVSTVRSLNAQASWVNPEEFRTQYSTFLGVLASRVSPADQSTQAVELRQKISQLQEQVRTLPFEPLNKLAGAHDRETFMKMLTGLSAERDKKKAAEEAPAVFAPVIDPPDNAGAVAGTTCGTTPTSAATLDAEEITKDVLKGVQIALNYGCESIVTILGEGTNLPFCIAAAIATVAEFVVESVEEHQKLCNDFLDGAQAEATFHNVSNVHADLGTHDTSVQNKLNALQTGAGNLQNSVNGLQTGVNNVQSSVNAVQSSVNNVQSSVNNVQSTVNTVDTHVLSVQTSVNNVQTSVNVLQATVNAFQALQLRLNIEHNLLGGPSAPIGLFELPASQGGYIALVRSIVVETINKMLAVGAPINNAQSLLAAGDSALAGSDFKTAYKDYQASYVAAVK